MSISFKHFGEMLQVLFIAFKLAGIIEWSWVVVMLPLIVGMFITAGVVVWEKWKGLT